MDFIRIAIRIAGMKDQFYRSTELDQMLNQIYQILQDSKTPNDKWRNMAREVANLVYLSVDDYEGTNIDSVVDLLDKANGKPIARTRGHFDNTTDYMIGSESEIIKQLQQILDQYGTPSGEDIEALEHEDIESAFLKRR